MQMWNRKNTGKTAPLDPGIEREGDAHVAGGRVEQHRLAGRDQSLKVRDERATKTKSNRGPRIQGTPSLR